MAIDVVITQEYVKELLSYNHDTGIFTWKPRPESMFKKRKDFLIWNSRFANKTTGSLDGKGYYTIFVGGKARLAHRLAWLHVFGEYPGCDIDHINGNRIDNRISNLRLSTRSENMQNQTKPRGNNKTTNSLGVSLIPSSGKFRARIKADNKYIHIGCFDTEDSAAQAYITAKRKYHSYGTL